MKKMKILLGLGLALGVASQAHAITLQFQSIPALNTLPEAAVVFDGKGLFWFESPQGNTGSQFQIVASDGAGDAVTDFGHMTGSFAIGEIAFDGGVQSASVFGGGTLFILDGVGNTLQGSLVWHTISTSGTEGFLNVDGTLNLTGVNYPIITGTPEQDLNALVPFATERVRFQLPATAALTLTELKNGSHRFAFTGSISSDVQVPDAGSTFLLLSMGVTTLLLAARRRS